MSYHLRRPHFAALLGACAVGLAVGGAKAEPAPPYAELLAQSQRRAPRLVEAEAGLRQAAGQAEQAAVRPNPTASLQAENFTGSGPYRGYEQAETTLSIFQPLELGGKRSARIEVGRAGMDAARARATQAHADFGFNLAIAYADAEATERREALAGESLALAQEDLRIARVLVDAGREAGLRVLQAEAAVTAAQADVESARAVRMTALSRLSALAGVSAPYTSISSSILARPSPVAAMIPPDVLSAPAVVTAQADREAAARRVRLERTKAAPDVTASIGVRRFSGDDSTAVVAGVSAPLPLFDRNRGNITSAQADLQAAEARLNAARLDAEAEIRTSIFQIGAADARLTAAAQGESGASEAYRLTRTGYETGKLPLFELLAARRALADAQARVVDAQLARVRAQANLARLQGRAPLGDRP